MISVCIPTYNGEKYIQKQLNSIMTQLANDDEVIISDDSSEDSTIDIIKDYSDNRIKLIEGCTFKNPIFNLENALKEAKGDFIFLADQDDIWLPDKVNTTLEKLTIYDIIVCNGHIVDENENIIHESYFKWKGSGAGFIKNLKKNSYLGCSLAFNRKILNYILPFPKKIAMHDIWIGMVVELIGKPYFIQKPLFLYRRHKNNFTAAIHKADHELTDNTLFYKIEYRVVMLIYLFSRYIKRKVCLK
ncbi:MAG: glycosyltransferase [Bacteroidetes bacterium]|nr:glycosyltransferase [Bacteroidota bacterium]